MRLFLLLFCLFNLPLAYAEATKASTLNTKTSAGIEYPAQRIFINDKGGSRTEMDCSEDSSITISCSFKQVVISHKDTKSAQESVDSLKNGNEWYIQEQLKSIEKAQNVNCNRIGEDHKGEMPEELSWNKKGCKALLIARNRSDLVQFFQSQLNREKETCILSHHEFSEKFKYDSKSQKWINKNFEPLCSTTVISSIEKDPRPGFNEFSWNYVVKNIVKDKSDNIFGKSCSSFDDSTQGGEISYGVGSLQHGTNTPVNCKYIDFTELF